MTPEWMIALGSFLAAVGGYLGYFITARNNRRLVQAQQETQAAQQTIALRSVEQGLIDQLQEERNRMDDKISAMRNEHREDLTNVRNSFESKLAEAVSGEALARQYVSTLLPLVPPPPPQPPIGWRA